MINLIVEEILRGYNHKSDEHLEIDEMFTLVKEIVPEIDKNFDGSDAEVMAAIELFDEDGDGTYDRSEVESFIKLMMDHGWTEGLKVARAKLEDGYVEP
jgi:Ca2+-binding EF-hand superfamily protein